MLRRYLFLILTMGLFIIPIPLWAQTGGECLTSLKVINKQEDVVLGHGSANIPKTHTLILKPTEDIPATKECSAYTDVKQIRLNNIENHDPVFQSLEKGDVITGTLHYHRPSPHGKMLNENYHHGLRVLSLEKRKGREVSAYGDPQYIYFRHIGLY